MLFVHFGFFFGGGVKINIVKFVWGSILNLLKLWGVFFLYCHITEQFSSPPPPPLLVNNDRSLKGLRPLLSTIKYGDNPKH